MRCAPSRCELGRFASELRCAVEVGLVGEVDFGAEFASCCVAIWATRGVDDGDGVVGGHG